MADIRPFRGIHYNQSLLREWRTVISPVYDIISPQQQDALYRAGEHNFIRIEFGREQPRDTAADDRYTRSAASLQQWLERGILEADSQPAVYIHDHSFTYLGKKYRRRGLIARVKLEEWSRGIIKPHEDTMPAPKSDRLRLLRALRANTSSVMSLYEDPGGLAGLLGRQAQGKPLVELKSDGGEAHAIWAVTAPAAAAEIRAALARRPFYIADGHHRYESALAYRHERLAELANPTGEEPFNFVMMTLVDFADPGLLVLPTHRLVRGVPPPLLDGLPPRLDAFFEIDELKLDEVSWRQVDVLPSGKGAASFALFGLKPDSLQLLKIQDGAAVNRLMPPSRSALYRRLDVSIIDHVILEKLLDMGAEVVKAGLGYSHEARAAVEAVLAGEYQFAFLVRPAGARTIKAIADIGDKMPRKSTYFYPKVPAGLIVNLLAS